MVLTESAFRVMHPPVITLRFETCCTLSVICPMQALVFQAIAIDVRNLWNGSVEDYNFADAV